MHSRQLSKHFNAADLCCAGETWKRTRIANEPQQAETWDALLQLCTDILEPVLKKFGRPEITYGFASQALLKEIPAHIAPKVDQHTSFELNRNGNPICKWPGAAVDFIVRDLSSVVLASWIVENLPFDSLYFYGADRPLHVSIGPANRKSIIAMLAGPTGRRIPKRIRADWLSNYDG